MTDSPRRQDIERGLRELGLSAGDRIIVHSSYRSLGRVAGGVPALIRALMNVITPQGTIMMPVFSHPVETWDVDDVPSRTGAVTEVFRQQHDVIRSIHPTHSVAVWGDSAEELIEGHLEAGALSVDSPMHRMAQRGCKTVSIGVDFKTLSLIHVAESIAKMPYLSVGYPGYEKTQTILRPDGSRIEFIEKEMPGDSVSFGVVEEKMRKDGKLIEGPLLNAMVIVANGQEVLDTAAEILSKDPSALLCRKERCPVCPKRIEILKREGLLK